MQVETFKPQNGVEYVKIHGLQRTGTNYVVKLVNDNFIGTQILVNIGGWKHGHYCAPWTLGREVHVLVVVKNPYAWLVSMYKWWGPDKKFNIGPDLTGVSFSEFVQNRAIFEEKDGAPALYRSANPVQHWNNMNFHWLSIGLNEKKKCVVPFEFAISDPNSCLRELANTFSLIQKASVKLCDEELLPGDELQVSNGKRWNDKNYYLGNQFLDWYDQKTLDFVNSQLDQDVVSHLGYSITTSLHHT